MANSRFGNFSDLSQGKKPMDAQEAWLMLKQLGLLGQEFVPGATSIRKVMEGKPMEAVDELVDWIPEGRAVQKFVDDEDQDWAKNAIDAMIIGKPLTKGAKKAFEAIERMPKGGKEGYIRMSAKNALDYFDPNKRLEYLKALQKRDPSITDATINELNRTVTNYDKLSPQAKEVLDGIAAAETSLTPRPEGWDKLSARDKVDYFVRKASQEQGMSRRDLDKLADRADLERYMNYKDKGRGPIYDEVLTLNDYLQARDELKGVVKVNDEARQISKAQREKHELEKAERKAAEQAAKEARWKAEREAAAKKAEEARLAKEAEARKLAEEQAEAERVAREEAEAAERAEAERKAQEEEFERQFREEEASERNRYADSVGTALGMEAVNKDIDDWLLERMIEDEEKQRLNRPIEMVQVEDFGNGILHNEGPAVATQGGRRNTYDHSRQFMDTELKQVPPIDRTGMIYGDDADAMYDIYKAWRDSKPNNRVNQVFGYDMAGTNAIRRLKDEAKRGKEQSNTMIMATDPYYAAGVVGDANVRLWNKIDALKAEGKTDKEIREILKDDLNKYQGQIERFKERMPSKGHGSQFDYDGATTQTLKALPSEEARALKALGINTPEYDELERLGNFYKVFFPK